MIAPPESGVEAACKHWLSAAATLLSCQWRLFEAQYQAGLKLVEAALGVPAKPGKVPGRAPGGSRPAITDEVGELERVAVERVKQGLAPPREIYQVPYRARIDWGRFPDWARPSDPELF